MSSRNRISVRLSDGQIARLRQACGDTGHNITDIIHQALDAFLSPDADLAPTTGPAAHLYPPEAILTAVRKYFAWGAGDPRVELRRQFAEILACSYALKRTFPRTLGIGEVYAALRPLCKFFGMDNV
jgi:hypothetical protein